MVILGARSVLLLQAAVWVSDVAARCRPACAATDPLLVLLRAEDDVAVSFCSDVLGLAPPAAVSVTVTPTVVATVTETSYATEDVTVVDATETVTVTATSSTDAAPSIIDAAATSTTDAATTSTPGAGTATLTFEKREILAPTWLPDSYLPRQVASACGCLSISLPGTTNTATADAVTVTAEATVTETETATVYATAVATETVLPPVSVSVSYIGAIEVLAKDTGAFQGWLNYNNGPGVTTDAGLVSVMNFTVPAGATTASGLRIDMAGVSPSALGFGTEGSSLEGVNGDLVTGTETPVGSPPVTQGKYIVETDIWTFDATTGDIGWQWYSASGSPSNIALWQDGGRVYPVGNLPRFQISVSDSAVPPVEVTLRYTMMPDYGPRV